jgi:hypothetical protein
MATQTIAFLNQPIRVMGRNGEDFATDVLSTLRRWAESRQGGAERPKDGGKVFVLSPETHAPWKVVILARERPEHHRVFAHVCSLAIGESQAIADRYAPLAIMEPMPGAVEVRLDRVPAGFFKAWNAVLGEHSAAEIREASFEYRPVAFVSTLDTVAKRWASIQAHGDFSTLLHEARLQPQIVGRGNDDLVVVSRSYLEALADPSSAWAMSQYFRGGGLSREGMPARRSRPLEPPRSLPELPEA